jgi:hypothetical protein
MASLPKRLALAAAIGIAALAAVAVAASAQDFGLFIENEEKAHSNQNFGVAGPLDESSQLSISAATASGDPTQLVSLAKQLKARTVAVVTGAPNIDMMALWPNDSNPAWIIVCNEQGAGDIGLIRIRISDGLAETIVASGLTSCDPSHTTSWGTIVFGEENGTSGRVFELIDPLNTSNVVVNPDGTTSGGTNPANIIWRPALGKTSFEGIGILPSGVVYYGDENRPATGTAGGAYFKFIPTTLRSSSGPITNLGQSPLTAGGVYGLRLGLRAGATDYGQGTQTGLGKWIFLTNVAGANLRSLAATNKLTGYYRPEDLAFDQVALAAGRVRFCGNNTGNEVDDRQYGDTICVTDGTLAEAATPTSVPAVQYLNVGNPEFAMMDNIAYQPGTGNWVIHEDGDQLLGNNDLWDCMDDGQDDNLLSDSCIRIGTLNDLSAEWTGGVFTADGKRFFVSVQHNVTGKGTVLEITGWK